METSNFIEEIINNDLESGKISTVVTRFPPEPNGYLHVGHSKSLSINFGAKQKYNGKCNLRFDDTNPTKEDVEYVNAIKDDIKWLGYEWDDELFASDYFEKTFDYAILLIKKGLAYVCDLSAEEIRETRGTLKDPGKNSPFRERSVEENLKLFSDMKNGAFPDGEKVLRAKIDMASPNINMRDPIIYRVLRATHHRTGDKWCIYPMYDFAHPIGDAIEGITHSICTLEFEDHRPLYDWVTLNCDFTLRPQQIEFARLNIKNTIMSKRYLKKLVDSGFVSGWSDPRMPTLSGMRERGYPAEAVKEFCKRVGVAKGNSEVDTALLEFCVRENLNQSADRVMVVENPLLMIIDNISDNEVKTFSVVDNPNKEDSQSHTLTFSNRVLIEKGDFEVIPPPKYKRLTEGGLIRLRGAYIVKHTKTDFDQNGDVAAIHCEFIPGSESGGENATMKVKGVVHWVNEKDCVDCQLYKYGYLLIDETDDVKDFNDRLNPHSLTIIERAKAEPILKTADDNTAFQFMRSAYYKKAKSDNGIKFYQIVGLKDNFNK